MGVSWCRWVWHCILASIYVVVASLSLPPPPPSVLSLSSPFPPSLLSFYPLLDQPYFFIVLGFLFDHSFCYTSFHPIWRVHSQSTIILPPFPPCLTFTVSLSSSPATLSPAASSSQPLSYPTSVPVLQPLERQTKKGKTGLKGRMGTVC